jgi:hypothetical protein
MGNLPSGFARKQGSMESRPAEVKSEGRSPKSEVRSAKRASSILNPRSSILDPRSPLPASGIRHLTSAFHDPGTKNNEPNQQGSTESRPTGKTKVEDRRPKPETNPFSHLSRFPNF